MRFLFVAVRCRDNLLTLGCLIGGAKCDIFDSSALNIDNVTKGVGWKYSSPLANNNFVHPLRFFMRCSGRSPFV